MSVCVWVCGWGGGGGGNNDNIVLGNVLSPTFVVPGTRVERLCLPTQLPPTPRQSSAALFMFLTGGHPHLLGYSPLDSPPSDPPPLLVTFRTGGGERFIGGIKKMQHVGLWFTWSMCRMFPVSLEGGGNEIEA